MWGLVCAAYGVPAEAAPPATSYEVRRFTRGDNPIFFPRRSREGLDLLNETETPVQATDNTRSTFEPVDDTIARKKHVVRKTPPAPTNRRQSTAEIGAPSQDDISDFRSFLMMSSDSDEEEE